MIRSYADQDAAELAALYNLVFSDRAYTPDGFRALVNDTLAQGGLLWVMGESVLIGYAMIAPVPGLSSVGDLTICISPDRHRSGLGRELLRFVLLALQATDFRQISHAVTDLASPTATLLRHHDFFVEHEEWLLELEEFSRLPDVSDEKQAILQVYPKATAVTLFCRLYDESFSGLPWNQPYTRAEVVTTIDDSKNMLFLTFHGQVIGFAGVSVDAAGKGLIEPLGILPSYQRQGFGRILLLAVMHDLIGRGAHRLEIGAWRDNEAAIDLYRSVGFRQYKTFIYLAFNISNNRS